MKRTYVNRLPKNEEVKNTNVKIENGKLIVEVEFEEKFEPKDGDFCVSGHGCMFIYSDMPAKDEFVYSSYCGTYQICDGISIEFSNNWTKKEGCRFATPEEKAAFLERLEKEYHKRWNEEKKRLEDIRWRAKKRESYYTINGLLDVVGEFAGAFPQEDVLHERGNYFRTPEAAQKVAEQIKDIFKNSKYE